MINKVFSLFIFMFTLAQTLGISCMSYYGGTYFSMPQNPIQQCQENCTVLDIIYNNCPAYEFFSSPECYFESTNCSTCFRVSDDGTWGRIYGGCLQYWDSTESSNHGIIYPGVYKDYSLCETDLCNTASEKYISEIIVPLLFFGILNNY